MFNQGLERETRMDKSDSEFRPFHKLIPGVGLGFGTAPSSYFAMDDCKIELDQFLGVTAYGMVCVTLPYALLKE